MKRIAIILVLGFWIGSFLPLEAESNPGQKDLGSGQATAADSGRGFQAVPDTKLRQIFTAYICDYLGKDESDVVVSRFKVDRNRPLPAGELDFELFQKSKGSLMGFVRLVAIVSVDGIALNEIKLSGWVDVFDQVVCTARMMQQGEIVKERDVHLVRKNISRRSSKVLTDQSAVIGLVLKRDLKENTCLKAWMLKKDPIVKRGDMVTILAELGGIRITAPGMIMEKGFAGDLIRVQNTMSQKKVYARIIDDTTVVVDF